MIAKAGLTQKAVKVPLVGKQPGTNGFGWDNCLEEGQADR